MKRPINSIGGIYKIINTINGKVYIGSSNFIKRRWYDHCHFLSTNNHYNKHLQSAWNKYGQDAFKIEIVEEIKDEALFKIREQHWMDHTNCCNPNVGYNFSKTALPLLYGRIFSDESKKRISEANTGRQVGEKAVNAKLTWKEVEQIRCLYSNTKISYRKLASQFSVGKTIIELIIKNKCWRI